MALSNIQMLSSGVGNVIIYVTSSTLEYIIRGMLKSRFNISGDFVVDVDTFKVLNSAKMDSLISPLVGDKWMINVNADKINKKELLKSLTLTTEFGLTVYWVSKYAIYKWLISTDTVKKQGVYSPQFYLGRLGAGDIEFLHSKVLSEKDYLSFELLRYVSTTYNYDVESICKLFTLLKSGNKVSSRKDIIELVGIGGNSVDNFVVSLLRGSYKTSKGRKKLLSKILNLLDDLSYSYKYSTIKNFSLNTLDGFIDMKQLQIMGYYSNYNKVIPESFDSKRLARLKRFEWAIFKDVSLPNLLNLKLCLKRFRGYDVRVSLVQAIIMYIDTVGSIES